MSFRRPQAASSRARGMVRFDWSRSNEQGSIRMKGTANAPILYWLAVICGLTGITVPGSTRARKVVPICSVRSSVFRPDSSSPSCESACDDRAHGADVELIIGPGLYVGSALFGFSTDTETALMALLPAFVCGYALAHRARRPARVLWYPAMLWMLVILDGEAPGSFAPRLPPDGARSRRVLRRVPPHGDAVARGALKAAWRTRASRRRART